MIHKLITVCSVIIGVIKHKASAGSEAHDLSFKVFLFGGNEGDRGAQRERFSTEMRLTRSDGFSEAREKEGGKRKDMRGVLRDLWDTLSAFRWNRGSTCTCSTSSLRKRENTKILKITMQRLKCMFKWLYNPAEKIMGFHAMLVYGWSSIGIIIAG